MNRNILDAVVVGTGFAGLCSAIKLRQAGLTFKVIEKDSGVGGVWRANTYPGAQCDVQSHLYSFSFEQNPNWSRTFGEQKEILAYLENCAYKYGINPHIQFNTSVTEVRWDEELKLWQIKTDKKDTYLARTFFLASGGLSQPLDPDIKGLDKFKGNLFHSARWDHSVDLRDKEVSIIGSAASAIQIIPEIAKKVKKLNVFQRTANWVIPKHDVAYTGLEKTLFSLFPPSLWASREAIYWQLEWRALAFVYFPQLMQAYQEWAKRHILSTVKNRTLAEKLIPNYTIGCKRILLSNTYYETLQRPNVQLVTEGIQEIDAQGILTNDGKRHDSDVIITATGFKIADGLVPFEIIGKNGISLNESWKNGPEAYLGTTIKGFPNLFMIVGPNTGLGHNSMVYMIEAQVHYAMKALEFMRDKNVASIEVRPQIQDSYNKEIQTKLQKSVWNTGGCNSWYKNKEGKNVTLWPGFTFEFKNKTDSFNHEDYLVERKSAVISEYQRN
jgi:cation diffusion facilitator CzcD-associated flavoprotein CzcO